MKAVIALIGILFAGAAYAQDFSDIRVETIARDMHFAEGPVWSLEGFLLFSDTVTDRIQKWVPGKGVSEFASRAGGTNGNAYDEQGRLYTCEFRDRRITRTSKNGKVDVLAARYEGKRLNAPNDIVVRRDGNVYFTDPAFGNQQDSKELDFYGVFRVTTKGELRRFRPPLGACLRPGSRRRGLKRACVPSQSGRCSGRTAHRRKRKCVRRGEVFIGLFSAGGIIEGHSFVAIAFQSGFR